MDNIYHESRGEPFMGQVLVAQTTINRALKQNKGICQVVYEPKQFSWTMKPSTVKDTKAWEYAAKAATLGLGSYRDVSYFHATRVKPAWAVTKTKVAAIGNHVFYK